MNSTHKKIIERRQVPDSPGLAGMHPLLARIYSARGVRCAGQTEYSLQNLPAPDLLKDIEPVCVRLAKALQASETIVIVGDYDVDGATSTALVVRALHMLGHDQVDYVVPDRFKYGYGLTPAIVDLASEKSPDIIITVDNGIASADGVLRARELGMEVIITDHHLPGEPLPPGTLCVNPNQQGDDFPHKNLAGVGVIFYVMLALRKTLREQGWFEATGLREPNLAELLDLVALGTVADVVPLDYLNRTLVAQGLRRINAGHCRPGIQALLEVGRRSLGRIIPSDMGFAVGPRLNAAGRLDDMSTGISCLLTQDLHQARELAAKLDELNTRRREIEQTMRMEAVKLADRALQNSRHSDALMGLCLYDENWHEGVVGIVAQRIRERSGRPVIAFARGADGLLKGSARSIPALHVRDLLEAIASRHPGLLVRFGGHAMAAGVTLLPESLQQFEQAWAETLGQCLSDSDLTHVVLSDGELDSDALQLDFAELLRNAGPWGSRFEEPVFDGIFRVVQHKIVGRNHLKLVLSPERDGAAGSGQLIDAICFNAEQEMRQACPEWLRLAYRLDVNEYRGQRSPQMVIEHMEPYHADN